MVVASPLRKQKEITMTEEIPLVYSKYNTETDLSTLTRAITFNGHQVPQNFTTDFTTTYWFIRWFIPRFGRANVPSVIHDWQYVNPLFTSKTEADENFRQNLLAVGYSRFVARLYWLGVVIGGRSFNDAGKQSNNPKVIAREARQNGTIKEDYVAVAVERTSGIIPGITRPKED